MKVGGSAAGGRSCATCGWRPELTSSRTYASCARAIASAKLGCPAPGFIARELLSEPHGRCQSVDK